MLENALDGNVEHKEITHSCYFEVKECGIASIQFLYDDMKHSKPEDDPIDKKENECVIPRESIRECIGCYGQC